MAKVLEIVELGAPVLRERAKAVEDISNPMIQNLIDDMIVTAKEASGVGLAAPQVGHSLRLFIISSYSNERYPDAPEMVPVPIINPQIVSCSEEMEKGWEGCLSIPGIRAPVLRHRAVKIRYFDREGQEFEGILEDFVARIFQHEFDHIEGIVFLDRLKDNSEIITENEYYKLFEDE
ncbi:MAG: peptide deformylase, partial [Candidatus Dadabacteria bacterium]|nr:peptide deformylase [Candidatus Dadabacteria bacterium]NIS07718.1 peptide deformylase [Candidatus Dadabacteria bacterium]NIV42323.1 peptide deformylase [Candidatus Dadabacteria bacterium]NIY21359.1 peptide deformylase [Candidatus Dadabacteria bacterium]